MLLADFEYVAIPREDMWAGMCTSFDGPGERPKEFEMFNFFIDKEPDYPYKIFHIPAGTIMKAALEAGFNDIHHKL